MHTYSVALNDVLLVRDQPFVGERARSIGLYNWHSMRSSWDEIFVGTDRLMGARCPNPTRKDAGINPVRKGGGWDAAKVVGKASEFSKQRRHANHVSTREVYKFDHGDLVPFDGPSHRAYNNDIHTPDVGRNVDADRGGDSLTAGALTFVSRGADTSASPEPDLTSTTLHANGIYDFKSGPNLGTSWGHARAMNENPRPKTGAQFWFDGHLNPGQDANFMGGVLCCSTQDFIVWKNEGIALHFANLSDPFGATGDRLQVQ